MGNVPIRTWSWLIFDFYTLINIYVENLSEYGSEWRVLHIKWTVHISLVLRDLNRQAEFGLVLLQNKTFILPEHNDPGKMHFNMLQKL